MRTTETAKHIHAQLLGEGVVVDLAVVLRVVEIAFYGPFAGMDPRTISTTGYTNVTHSNRTKLSVFYNENDNAIELSMIEAPYTGCGLGRVAMEAFIRWIDSADPPFDHSYLDAVKQNQDWDTKRLMRFYEHYGYVRGPGSIDYKMKRDLKVKPRACQLSLRNLWGKLTRRASDVSLRGR